MECSDPGLVRKGIVHLRKSDRVLAKIIEMVGDFRLKPRLPLLSGLVSTIISQQLGEPAAWTLYKRFLRLYPNERPSANLVHMTPISEITKQGISLAKATLIKELASDISSKKLNLRVLGTRQNDLVVTSLTYYKGIGEWTAHVFLMFSLGRIDALPLHDLALRRAIIKAYKIGDDDSNSFEEITEKWKPYRTLGSWYMWQSLGISSI